MCLHAGELHAVEALEDASLLLTILRASPTCPTCDPVQAASEESFPASDPPSQTPVVGM